LQASYTGGGVANAIDATNNGGYAAVNGTNTGSGPAIRGESQGSTGSGVYAKKLNGNYALYVEGTSFFTGAKTGYVADICLSQDGLLEEGDVVEISDASVGTVSDKIPMMMIKKSTTPNSTKIVGVADAQVSQSADTVFVVTLGAYRSIKVDADYGTIQPGDLLTSSATPGYAMKASAPIVGSIIGKALEPLLSGKGKIKVFVSVK